MGDVSFNGVAIVAAVALGAPLALGLFPKLRLPAVVLEIVLGIVIGPQVLGWVSIDTPISTGVSLDLDALFASAETIARVPMFLGALLVARGLPALVYRRLVTRTQTAVAALLQATSLSFLVVAGQIGVQLDLIRPATYAALVAAGLLSVLLFPAAALGLLRQTEQRSQSTAN